MAGIQKVFWFFLFNWISLNIRPDIDLDCKGDGQQSTPETFTDQIDLSCSNKKTKMQKGKVLLDRLRSGLKKYILDINLNLKCHAVICLFNKDDSHAYGIK